MDGKKRFYFHYDLCFLVNCTRILCRRLASPCPSILGVA